MQSSASSWTCRDHTGQCPATRLPCCRVYLVGKWEGTGMERKWFKSRGIYNYICLTWANSWDVSIYAVEMAGDQPDTRFNHIQTVYGISSIKSTRQNAKSTRSSLVTGWSAPPSTKLPNPSQKSQQWPLTNLKGHSVQHAQLPQNFFMAGLPYRSTCPCFSAFRCLSSALSIGSAPTSPSPHCAPWRRRRRPLRPFRSTGWAGRQASTPPVEAKSAVNLASCGCQETSVSAKHGKFLRAVPIDFHNIRIYIYIIIYI